MVSSNDAVGSNATAVRRAVQRAARTAKADVRVEAARVNAGETSVDVAVHLGALGTRDEPADVHLAVVENGLSTQVPRGENRGRTLTHDAVVRRNEVVATPEPGRRDLKAAQRVPIDEDWKAENVRIVAFLQERESRRVLGAASAKPVAVERARDAQ